MTRRPSILFVCVRNAGRSQMAAAFARRMGGGRATVLSAGSDPAEAVHSSVVEAMKEVGIDIAKERPRKLDPAVVLAADVVVTMGCGDACPAVPGKRRLEWKVADPAGQPLFRVRAVRDALRDRVAERLDSLGVETIP